MRGVLVLAVLLALLSVAAEAVAQEDDGAYGRLDGDLSLSIEAGISEAIGREPHAGEALALRTGIVYLQTVGLAVQYDEGLGVDALPMRRAVAGTVELRPLFWGRFSENLERGPAFLDLFLDSFGIAIGMFGAWPQPRFCGGQCPDCACPDCACPDYGMQAGIGFELPLLPRASAPFIGLRGAMRWSLRDRSAAYDASPVSGLLTLTLGYRHLFETHLVDAADRMPP